MRDAEKLRGGKAGRTGNLWSAWAGFGKRFEADTSTTGAQRCCAPTLDSPPGVSGSGAIQMSYKYRLAVQLGMHTAIQARLDERSRRRLAVLVRELGWTPSQVVREGLRVLEASYLRRKRRGVIGLGKFRSGIADLGSNKKHLREFGRRSRYCWIRARSWRCWTGARSFTPSVPRWFGNWRRR